jgi:predicted alpha/beta-hydrolase family hydrolase
MDGMPERATAPSQPQVLELPTPHGPAHAHVHAVEDARAALVLGHGANGSIGTPDLTLATSVALGERVAVALVEQPYRVAGRKSPSPAHQLDAAWTAAVAQLRAGPFEGLPILVGGRSSGARVACRTAAETNASAVLCLAFPVHPPGKPEKSRLSELDAVTLPVLVVQGANDPFGMPPEAAGREVVTVPGNHSLAKSRDQVAAAVGDWLERILH